MRKLGYALFAFALTLFAAGCQLLQAPGAAGANRAG